MSEQPFGNDPVKTTGYTAFWQRERVDRPLVGFSLKSWFPVEEFEASRAWGTEGHLTPDQVQPDAYLDEQEALLREGERIEDDIFRGACPHQGIGWLAGMLGLQLRLLPGSTMQEHRCLSWDEIGRIALDPERPWYRKYMEFIDVLVQRAGGRYPVSHGMLSGPTDMLSSFRGPSQGILDLMDHPHQAGAALWHFAEILKEITELAWQRLPLYQGGYYDAQYQLWAPGPIIRMQEDAAALYSPDLYRRFVQPVDRYLAGSFASAFMHLHTTTLFLLDAILEIEELPCLQMNYELHSGGPAIDELLPYLREIQEADRCLILRGSFEADELRRVVEGLDPSGLYLYIMVESLDEVRMLRPIVGL
jgi:hypothetical protein